MTRPLILAERVVAGYKRLPIVGPISFRCDLGEALLVRGAPGSGKSTLLEMLLGRAELIAGRCEVMGADRRGGAWSLRPWSLPLGAVWSSRDAPEGLTVSQLLRLARATNAAGEFIDKQVESWIGATSLFRRMASEVGVLSGGERTVLVMACALARSEQGLLIVDDLSASLQPSIVETLLAILLEDIRVGRRGIIFTENNAAIADVLATAVVTITEPGTPGTPDLHERAKGTVTVQLGGPHATRAL